MGGRGSEAPQVADHLRLPLPGEPIVPSPEELGYQLIDSHALAAGGARYDFLERAGRAWRIVTRPLDGEVDVHPTHRFGMDAPTLRWVKDDGVVDVYVDGMTTGEFLAATGLELSMARGGFVLAKRLSRVMRPHFASGEFAPEEVSIRYLEQDASQAKVWDGAAVVSRRLLLRLAIPDDASPAKAARLRRELARARRVEFTLLSERGQDKGHAIVSDTLDVDCLLPDDTKGEVKLRGGRLWVGVGFVHGKGHMRTDVQSLINLHPFFDVPQLAAWLQDEGTVFARAVETGEVVEPMARIDRRETLEDVGRWALREYFASGGHPMWFAYHTKALMNRHLERLNHSTLGKLRLPIPGGRYYVMPEVVARAAGLDVTVPRGELRLDLAAGTAWVNDQDWLVLEDSPSGEGIAGILGGADHDDALWVHAFTDHDGQRRLLAWRSPNQAGEYVVLRPAQGSDIPQWTTAEGEGVRFPPGDSRRLPPRIDTLSPDYLSLVDPATAGGLGEGQPYSAGAMAAAIERARANRGALGMTCNSLMLSQAVTGGLPEQPPAPLEDVIDASVKTGADLSRVVGWNYAHSRRLLERGTPIPALLHDRLSVDYSDRENLPPPPRATSGHWLDRLERVVRDHIRGMETRRDALAARAMPPRKLFDSVFADPGAVELGAKLNATYGRALAEERRANAILGEAAFDRARQAAEAYLNQFPAERQTAILRGAMASAYIGEAPASDAAVWLMGPRTEAGRAPGIAQASIRALREVGLLDEVAETSEGLLVYPGAVVDEPRVRSVGLTGVWFNLGRARARAQGQPVPERMADVPRHTQRALKAEVAQLAASRLRDALLRVDHDETGKLVTITERNNVFGYLKGAGEDIQPGDRLRLRGALARDGSLRAVYTKVADDEG